MPKPFKPVVLTANDLVEGDSVFLGAEGWVRDVAEARVAMTGEAAAALEAEAEAEVGRNVVVGPYRVEVSFESGTPEPVLRRERIRASRLPTIPFGPARAARPRGGLRRPACTATTRSTTASSPSGSPSSATRSSAA